MGYISLVLTAGVADHVILCVWQNLYKPQL